MRVFLAALSLAVLAIAPAGAAELAYWSPQIADHPSTVALKSFVAELQGVDKSISSARLMGVKEAGIQSAVIKAVQEGKIGVAVLNSGTVARAVPEARVLNLPFLFRDSQRLFTLLDGSIGASLEKEMAAKGMVVVGWFDGGSRAFYMRDKLQNLADLNAAKLRVPGRADLKTLISTLGGEPMPLAYDKINAALDSGLVDGAENDIVSYETSQNYKRARYYALNPHFVQYEALVVSAKVWERIPEAQRTALRQAGHVAAASDREMWGKRVQQTRARLEKDGVKFVDLGGNRLTSRVTTLYKPYLDNPETAPLLIRLMTARS